MSSYAEFLAQKAQLSSDGGFEPTVIPDHLFPYQRSLLEWSVRLGRAAIFADCGLGKTPMELAWAQNVYEHTGKPVLLLTPLAVGFQIIDEAAKFGHEAALSRDGRVAAPITVTNYEQLQKFDPEQFSGVVCDESSAIKSFDGETRAIVTEFMRRRPYRLLGTATAAPNDYIELGTSSEALGALGYMDMLSRFFVNDNRTATNRSRLAVAGRSVGWRLKGHASAPFWRWVVSWARAVRRPSDLGFDDDGFELPELIERVSQVEARTKRADTLFDMPAVGLQEEREETRRTLVERCEAAAELVENSGHDTSIVWCNLNDEGNLLERLIPRSIQVSGSDSSELKEKAAEWFIGKRCICNDPTFSAKLARWDGSRSTRRADAASTSRTQRSALDDLVSRELAKQAASTCGTTTTLTPTKFRRTPQQRAEYNRKRRERYANDPEFRDRVRQQARITPEQRHARKCREYGITVADYNRLLTEQGGGCAICGDTVGNKSRLAIDHDHTTGKVRGLLCRACNQGLGQFGDDPERLDRAGMYLRTHRRTSSPDK